MDGPPLIILYARLRFFVILLFCFKCYIYVHVWSLFLTHNAMHSLAALEVVQSVKKHTPAVVSRHHITPVWTKVHT